MKLELHMIQNFAPSCLNRDDTNTPKDCEFGGCRRARISSQCLKRSIRTDPVFRETLAVDVGVRTKQLKAQLLHRLTNAGKDQDEASNVLDQFIPAVAAQMDKKHPEDTSVLLYLGRDEIDTMTQELLDNWRALASEKKAEKIHKEVAGKCRGGTKAADVAMFGRMMADQPKMNIDAACQVAQAISTHRVSMEMDFYTAVDDLQPRDEPGAGMMGVIGFNSSCFYRYALIATNQLVDNLSGDTELAHRAVEAFIRASRQAIPTGKQNSMAAQNPPSLILSVVRERGAPCSLANAFAKPVRPGRDEDLVGASIRALDDYWARLVKAYGADGIVTRPVLCLEEDGLENLADQRVDTFEDLVTTTMQALGNGGSDQ